MLIIEFEKSFEFFLSRKVSHGRVGCPLNRKASVKDIVESYGVPHTEIGSLVFDRRPVDFSFVSRTGGILSVGAIQPPFDVCSPSFLRPHPACAILKDAVSFFTRCTRCNTLLQPVTKAAVLPLLEPKTRRYYNEFFQCPRCGQVYWPGSHRHRILEKMRAVGLETDII